MKDFERFLPNQTLLSNYYTGEPENYERDMYACIEDTVGLKNQQQQFDFVESDRFSYVELGTSPICMTLFETLFLTAKVKSVLEIGTFIGVSTMQFARLVGEHGKVVGIEKFDEFADIAQENFKRNELSDRIDLHRGDAMEVLSKFEPGQFDFVYIDGDKGNYWKFFEIIKPLMQTGGIVVFDDVLFNGDVLNNLCTTDKGQGCKQVLENIKKLNGYQKTILPISNGVAILIKD